MEKYEKEVARAQLNNEKDVLEKLKELYQKALDDINEKIASLLTREDSDMQYVIYQVQYQHALKKQIQSILIQLQNEEFDSISEYLTKCYEDGYEGALYALQKQGIPLAIPIDQDLVVEAIQHETKLSEDLYTSLGKNIEDMQKKIQSEISRGIATGKMYQDIAADLSRSAGVSYNNAMRIARTEGHRIQCKATMDACYKAQDRGAEIVKQWNAALDARTRDSHLKIDGEIKNLDEKFSNGLLYPGDPAGKASEVINCRCTLSQRARWALEWSNQTKYLGDTDAMSDKQLQVIADKLHISVSELKEYSNQIIPIKAKDYSDFKEQYSKIWNYHGSKAEKEAKERIEKRRTEQREKRKEENKKKKSEIQEASLRTKDNGEYGVNWNIVKSKEYTARFNAISGNEKANALAAQRSRNALVNRTGKNTEELYAISLTKGTDISSITDQHTAFGVHRTEKFDNDVKRAEMNGEKILFIHNHPRGLPPSIVDLNELLNHEDAVGITVGHNGSIYFYTKSNEKIKKLDEIVAIRKNKQYNGIELEEKVIEELSKQFGFKIKKI